MRAGEKSLLRFTRGETTRYVPPAMRTGCFSLAVQGVATYVGVQHLNLVPQTGDRMSGAVGIAAASANLVREFDIDVIGIRCVMSLELRCRIETG